MTNGRCESLRVLIVDDEALARRGIRDLLEAGGVRAEVFEAASGRAAVGEIRARAPDLVFLDIQMPGLDGFGVIQEVGVDAMPPVVFVTAYDEYALRAFDAHAVDYLLKPVSPDRFGVALRKARRAVAQTDITALRKALANLVADARAPLTRETHISIRDRDRVVLLQRQEIGWIEADANYVKVHAAGTVLRHRSTLDEMQSLLGEGFVRISRSLLVRVGAIRYCEPWSRGSYQLVLHDRTRLVSSRHYRDRLVPILGSGS